MALADLNGKLHAGNRRAGRVVQELLSGTVTVGGLPAERTIIAYLTRSPSTFFTTTSDPSTGYWELLLNLGSHDEARIIAVGEPGENSVIYEHIGGLAGPNYTPPEYNAIDFAMTGGGSLPPTVHTPKSVIIDIANNWSSSTYLGVRAVEFYLEGVLQGLAAADFTAYSTSVYSADYLPANAFDTSLSKTGTWVNTGFIAGNLNVTNQRLICVFDTPMDFDEIRIANAHTSGTLTAAGVNEVTISLSSDEITDTTYGAAITNSTLFYSGQVKEHVGYDVEDSPLLVTEVAETEILAKSVVFDIADNWGDVNYLGIRSIEFYLRGELIHHDANTINATATTTAPGYTAEMAIDTNLPKTGAATDNQWFSTPSSITNQRFSIVFNAPLVFDTVVVNNAHASGTLTERGMKNVVVKSSPAAVSGAVYGQAVFSSSVLFDSVVDEHVAADQVDDFEIFSTYTAPALPVITAKSVILDIADNWGDPSFLGLRAVDFYYRGSKLPITAADITGYETSTYSAVTRLAIFVFDTTLSKTGGASYTSWLSATGQKTNQRLICVFNTPQMFDEIRVNNEHATNTTGGGETDRGSKNVKITVSSDDISDNTYDAAVTNSSVIFNGQFNQHTAADVEDEQILTLEAPPEVEYTVSGIVTEGGVPVARTVRVYERESGDILGRAVSSSIDGTWSVTLSSATPVYAVAFDDEAGTQFNAIISDRITPN